MQPFPGVAKRNAHPAGVPSGDEPAPPFQEGRVFSSRIRFLPFLPDVRCGGAAAVVTA